MCTAMFWKGSGSYFGRNLDIEKSFGEEVVFVPKNFSFDFPVSLKSRFAMVGIGIVKNGYPLFYDGMNEKGLAIAGLRFKDAGYSLEISEKSIAPYQIIPFLLSGCENCREAREALETVSIAKMDFSGEYPCAPLHWMISDKNESLTVECTEIGTRIYENTPGILTNMPSFDIQLFNLNNFINLTPMHPENRFSDCLKVHIYSRGMGAIGLPGDMSSMSRFVRGAFVKLNSNKNFSDEAEEKSQFFHMLYSVYQPKGCTMLENGDEEYTLYTSCYNLNKCELTYTTYNNWGFNVYDMKSEDCEGDTLVNYPLNWK